MNPRMLSAVLTYGALAALLLACLWLISFAGLALDWGRELLAAAIALVAVVVGLRLADRRRGPSAAAPETAPGSRPAETDPALEALLSPRERRILALLAEGLANKEIAQALSVSENTVKTHLANLYAKLEVGKRTEAVAMARRRGLLG